MNEGSPLPIRHSNRASLGYKTDVSQVGVQEVTIFNYKTCDFTDGKICG